MTQRAIFMVGAGFLGSLFAEEVAKLFFAGEKPHDFFLIDGDRFERRNAANQNVRLAQATDTPPKAAAVADILRSYEREADWEQRYLTEENADEYMQHVRPWVLIDAVDNLKARQLTYNLGLRYEVPVLHVGITQDGTGTVEWSYMGHGETHDTFSLSPQRTLGKTILDPESGVKPPCELVRMRGVGLNVSHAAALSLALFFGFDPYSFLAGEPTRGWMTEWRATPTGFFEVRDTWGYVESATVRPTYDAGAADEGAAVTEPAEPVAV
jgi:hypothetical protein